MIWEEHIIYIVVLEKCHFHFKKSKIETACIPSKQTVFSLFMSQKSPLVFYAWNHQKNVEIIFVCYFFYFLY
jgi:hypothetical protein